MRLALLAAVAVTCAVPACAFAQSAPAQGEVTLVAEPVASTPPLYQGKAEFPLEGNSRFVAVASFHTASGKAIDPATLNYAWMVDGTNIIGGSGIGKTVLMVASPLQYRSRSVSVTVASPDGTTLGSAATSFTPVEPELRVYASDPLLGIRFERALSGTLAITTSEESLYAAPFSFATSAGAPALQWFLDNALAQTGNVITMHPQGNGAGSASVSVVASGADTIRATQVLSISFGSKSSSLFGL